MRPVLDFLFVSDPTTAASSHMPYYFLYLAGYLRERGFTVKILDHKSRRREGEEEARARLWRGLNENPARFIGLSSYTPHYDSTLWLGDHAKMAQPKATVVVGNAHATVRPQDFLMKGGPFDVVVLGEGERPLLDLASGIRWESVPGIAYGDGGEVVRTEPAFLLHPKDIAVPAYELVDMDWYLRPQKDLIRRLYTRSVYVFASRGCASDCDFCSTNMIWKANRGKRVRKRPLVKVLGEVWALKARWGAEFIYMADDTFGWDRDWLRDWFRRYSVPEYLPYAVQTRADLVTEDMVRGLKATGCLQLDVGVESGSQALLDRVGKGITVGQVEQVAEWCRKHRLRLFVFLMVNLPGETEDDLRATERLMGRIRTAGCTVSVCTPYPGTRLNSRFAAGETTYDYRRYISDRASFRMAAHSLDLRAVEARWNRRFGAEPMFERMWPASSTYWRALLGSGAKLQYMRAWAGDLPVAFAKWWARRLGLAPLARRMLRGGA